MPFNVESRISGIQIECPNRIPHVNSGRSFPVHLSVDKSEACFHDRDLLRVFIFHLGHPSIHVYSKTYNTLRRAAFLSENGPDPLALGPFFLELWVVGKTFTFRRLATFAQVKRGNLNF